MKKIVYSIGLVFYAILTMLFFAAPILTSLLTITPLGFYVINGFYKYQTGKGKANITLLLSSCFILIVPISALILSFIFKIFI